MHIPSKNTTEIAITSFLDALKQHESTADSCYCKATWLNIPEAYQEYRYLLGTRGKRTLICAGINPSTAVPDALDNTLKSVSRIAAANGFDSWMMFNVYAQRATNPNDMDPELNTLLHRENMAAFEYALSLSGDEPPSVWAAWGTIIEKRRYLARCVADMAELAKRRNAVWLKAGAVSLRGHPHHPLYLKKDAKTEPFDMAGYIAQLTALH